MKKSISIFGAILFTSLLFTSCDGNSIERDAEKVADLQCKAQKAMAEVTSGDMSALTANSDLMLEAAALAEKMEGKYISDADQQKFAEAYLKALNKC